MFQSPSLRGSGRFGGPGRPQQAQQGFNPLHCGAVVASTVGTIIRGRVRVEFQSPSLRGSGRFRKAAPERAKLVWFQSPSLRGSGRFKMNEHLMHCRIDGFNPLHCGAVVASRRRPARRRAHARVSIPFIAGQWSLLPACVFY